MAIKEEKSDTNELQLLTYLFQDIYSIIEHTGILPTIISVFYLVYLANIQVIVTSDFPILLYSIISIVISAAFTFFCVRYIQLLSERSIVRKKHHEMGLKNKNQKFDNTSRVRIFNVVSPFVVVPFVVLFLVSLTYNKDVHRLFTLNKEVYSSDLWLSISFVLAVGAALVLFVYISCTIKKYYRGTIGRIQIGRYIMPKKNF